MTRESVTIIVAPCEIVETDLHNPNTGTTECCALEAPVFTVGIDVGTRSPLKLVNTWAKLGTRPPALPALQHVCTHIDNNADSIVMRNQVTSK